MASHPEEPPSFDVQISDQAARHIHNKHVSDPLEATLWTDFLTPQPDIARALEPEIQRSFLWPLYVEYDQHDENGALLHRTREFVTRPGLVVVVRLADDYRGEVVTAFFPSATFDARRQRRWMRARESRIKLYAIRLTYGLAQSFLTPPSPVDVFPSADPRGERRNVRFVNDERWGIRPQPIADSDCRVFGPPPPWPEG